MSAKQHSGSSHALQTPRLRLTPAAPELADTAFAPLRDERLWQFFPHMRPATVDALRERFARWQRGPDDSSPGHLFWENWIGFSEDDAVVGLFQATVLLDATALVAYSVVPAFWRQGFAREAVTAVIAHLRDVHQVKNVCADIERDNLVSRAFIESLGFEHVSSGEDVRYCLPPRTSP